MKYYYSRITGWLYIDELNGQDLPADAIEIPVEKHQELLTAQATGKIITVNAEGYPVLSEPLALTKEQKIAAVQNAVTAMLNKAAFEKGYKNDISGDGDIKAAALRAGYPGPFHDEGVAFATWMDACWDYCYSALAAIEAGTRQEPTVEEFLAELPERPALTVSGEI